MKRIFRIYVAGPINTAGQLPLLHNMRRGMELSLKVLLSGFAPFTPWHDYHHILLDHKEQLSLQNMYEYSLAWLEVSDAIIVLPNSENSKGTQAEIKRAKELGLPVFYDLKSLKESLGGKK